MKICIVTSPGGHLYHCIMLKKWWELYDRCWVSLRSPDAEYLLAEEEITYANGPENRNGLNFFKNFFLAPFILLKAKPNIVFSAGAGIAPPFFVWAKILRIKTIYLEPYDFIHQLSLTGKLLYYLSDYFLVQHKSLLKKYPRAIYRGSIV